MENPFTRPKPPPGSPPTKPPILPHILSIGKSAHDVLWVAFFVFVLSTLLIAFLASRLPVKHRVLHYITLVITGVAALSHYAMATNGGLGFVYHGRGPLEDSAPVLRQVFWARYADWAITVPLILLDLALLAGLPWVDIVLLVLAGDAAVACTTFSALIWGPAGPRWGWYAFSLIFLALVFLTLILKGRKCAKNQRNAVTRLYTILMIYTMVIGIIYPIVFALGKITGIIVPNTEVIVETILDVLAKAVFGILLLVVHKHDSEDVSAARFSEAWLEVRGARGGIHLPGGDS